jgi:hypothetical protein
MPLFLKIFFGALLTWVLGTYIWSYVTPYGVGLGHDDEFIVQQTAIQNHDITICDEIHLKGFGDVSKEEFRNVCYRVYARALPDENVCARLAHIEKPNEVGEQIGVQLCVIEQAGGLGHFNAAAQTR